MFTYRRLTLESPPNRKSHTYLTEKIRKKVSEMENQDWRIEFIWIKASSGHFGIERAEKTAKEAATNSDIGCYKSIPKIAVRRELNDNSVIKW